MKIETSKGKIFDIRAICPALRNNNAVLIEVCDDRPLALIAVDFDGLESFRKYDENIKGVSETYTGYSRIINMRRNEEAGTVRLMLERDEDA